METIALKVRQGYSVVVPASLRCITTYVLLEQERWFEFEIDFLTRYLKPGMTAIDIGANLGLYALPMATSVGPDGMVFAYEPGQEARACLTASAKLNGLQNLLVSPCALSSRPGQLWLAHGSSGELNELKPGAVDGGAGEVVDVVTLDDEQSRHAWANIDFIKIDAEGQEARIAVGGRDFFARHSPLVMYEVVDAGEKNHQLRWMFEVLGYRTYKLCGDSSYLVRVDDDDAGVGFELNYFSAKADRAENLAAAGLLLETVAPFSFSDHERADALAALLVQPFAIEMGFSSEDFAVEDAYSQALLAYAAYLYLEWPVARRHSALVFAYEQLRALNQGDPSAALMTTLSRVAMSLHYRMEGVELLGQLRLMIGGETVLDRPFFPASARFERLAAGEDIQTWFGAAIVDSWVRLATYSTQFAVVGGGMEAVTWLANGPYADAEIYRRACFWSLKTQEKPNFPLAPADEHLNASYWASGAERLLALVKWTVTKFDGG